MTGPVASPCAQKCKIIERSGLCRGCGRSLEEIRAWKTADDDQRRAILTRLPGRLATIAADPANGEA